MKKIKIFIGKILVFPFMIIPLATFFGLAFWLEKRVVSLYKEWVNILEESN
jgi:hypothetical protein